MKHQIFSTALVEDAARKMKVANLQEATIGEVLLVASYLEKETGIPFIRMDQGSPGLPANRIGIEAEKAALDRGVGATYPAAAGIQELKDAASRFVKAFINTDISPRACIPTTGSVALVFCLFHRLYSTRSAKRYRFIYRPGVPHTEITVAHFGREVGTIRHLSFQRKQLAGQIGVVSRKRPYRSHYLFQSQ